MFNILGGPASVKESVVEQLPNEFKLKEGTDYVVKNESGRLAIYQGSAKIADFGTSSFILKPEVYSQSNILTIKAEIPCIIPQTVMITPHRKEIGRRPRPLYPCSTPTITTGKSMRRPFRPRNLK